MQPVVQGAGWWASYIFDDPARRSLVASNQCHRARLSPNDWHARTMNDTYTTRDRSCGGMGRRNQRLCRAKDTADADPARYGPADLAPLAASPDADQRLLALFRARTQINRGAPPGDYLGLARALIEDADNACRWQAMIVVGESIESDPEAVWRVICDYGGSRDEDMRAAVATVLLEELLGRDFDAYFPRVKERVRGGDIRLADTLSMCWATGEAKSRWNKVENFLRRMKL